MKTSYKGILLSACLVSGVLGIGKLFADDMIVFNKNNSIVYQTDTKNVDRVALEDGKSKLVVYGKDKNAMFNSPVSEISDITIGEEKPVADLLDVQFNADGTATDLSPMKLTIEAQENGTQEVYYNETYHRYAARFNNTWGGALTGKYKIDFENNEAVRNALADGHTLEAVVMANYDNVAGDDKEAKFFSAQQAGGTGLMVCKAANGIDNQQSYTFLANVTTDGKTNWRFTPSAVFPTQNEFHHIVGVWNKEEGKAYVYVDGVLKNTVDAQGDLKFASAGSNWFCVGGDSDAKNGGNGWIGDVVIARAYDKPLNAREVALLWNDLKPKQVEKPVADLLDVVFNEDGSATDISPMQNAVTTIGEVEVAYNRQYHRNMAVFTNPWAGNATGCYKVDYSTNQKFKDAIADGHTLETIVCADYTGDLIDGEAKFFAAHEAGGTGLMVCKKANGMNGTNEYTFLPNVGGYKWAVSGVVPMPKVYHHIVGVWNKEEGKARIYVDGVLKNTVDAAGEYKTPAAAKNQWFGIGTDAGGNGQFSWTGNLVTAKIYDKPLDEAEVALLWNEIKAEQVKPVADILDVQFNEDGTATDLSPMKLTIEPKENGTQETYYNQTYKRYVAKFNNNWGKGNTAGNYKVDFENNEAVRNALADGHTLEALVMADYDGEIADVEAKFFAAHEAGGTGLMVCKKNNSLNKDQNEYIFLPNVSENGKSSWKWAVSGVFPTPKVYRHIVGVWNQEEGKAYVYVDGELKNTIDAAGNLNFAKAGANWFCIGGDSQPNGNGQLGWIGDVVLARAYDKPLTQSEVDLLWDEIATMQEDAQVDFITDVDFYSGVAVKIGGKFSIYGTGFQAGDKLELASSDNGKTFTLDITPAENGMSVTIPEGFESGKYRMKVQRDADWQDLGTVKLEVMAQMPEPAQVIAHRGFHDGNTVPENSVAAFKRAQENGLYGSEMDIWLTTDGKLVVNHNATRDGVTIQNFPYSKVENMTLPNGEKLPLLENFLDALKENTATKLIIEIKEHNSDLKNQNAAKAAIDAVKAAGMQDHVEYISFSLVACKEVAKLDPTAYVAYLTGGTAPQELKNSGINGLDYNIAEFRDHPEWITQAKELGMTVNVWTVNTMDEMAEMTNAGVQFITTDQPLDAVKIKNYYTENK